MYVDSNGGSWWKSQEQNPDLLLHALMVYSPKSILTTSLALLLPILGQFEMVSVGAVLGFRLPCLPALLINFKFDRHWVLKNINLAIAIRMYNFLPDPG